MPPLGFILNTVVDQIIIYLKSHPLTGCFLCHSSFTIILSYILFLFQQKKSTLECTIKLLGSSKTYSNRKIERTKRHYIAKRIIDETLWQQRERKTEDITTQQPKTNTRGYTELADSTKQQNLDTIVSSGGRLNSNSRIAQKVETTAQRNYLKQTMM